MGALEVGTLALLGQVVVPIALHQFHNSSNNGSHWIHQGLLAMEQEADWLQARRGIKMQKNSEGESLIRNYDSLPIISNI